MDRLKRFIATMVLCLTALFAYSQVWTAQDSLHLKKLLESDQELHLNMDAVKSIDFGTAVGTPRMSEEKSWMMPDESLPEALPKPKVVLSLMPYKANTRYNWDPIYQKKIKIDKNTWRGDPFYEIRHQRSYSNWARNPMAKGVRKSLDEIQASGVRFRQLSERANGMMVNTVVMDAPIPLFGGSGVYINGGTVGGLDLMAVFTKEFWNKKGRDNRARTLEVLRTYGDSTTYYPMPFLSADNILVYKSAFNMNMFKVIDLIAIIQEHIDQGISTTLFVDSETSTKELARYYIYAHKKNLKALYYTRTKNLSFEECLVCSI